MLTLVFVQTLYLNVEIAVGIYKDITVLLYILCLTLLIILLYFHNVLKD